MNQDKVSETLAVNTGNIIASLNMQIAKLQVAHKLQEDEIKDLKAKNDQLKIKLKEVSKGKPNKVIKVNR